MRLSILIADDEPMVRRFVSDILTRAAYEVLTAEDGMEAFEHIQKRDGDVDLVITDIRMPRMGGDELARRLRTEYPDLPILFMSGFTDVLPPGKNFLPKPFTAGVLLSVVQKALE
jgi:two-component system cell cycle sensor histidine kinase/response regulator CckA